MPVINNVVLTADGSTTPVFFKGGDLYASCGGTFGSGTITLEVAYGNSQAPVTPYVSVGADGTKTAAATFTAVLPECWVRWTLSGSTTPSITTVLATQGRV
jgi:hypothetical protein